MIQATTAPGPGIYPAVPFEVYVTWPYISQSMVNSAYRRDKICMADMQAYMEGRKTEQTKPMRFGIFTHTGRLEPIRLMQRYVVMPPFEKDTANVTGDGKPSSSKTTSYYKGKVADFKAMHAGKETVEQADYDRMFGIFQSIAKYPHVCRCFDVPGEVELSIVWDDEETGIRCKARIDKVAHDMKALPDLKTTADLSRFDKAISDYGYHRQGAMYEDGWLTLTGNHYRFWLVPVESDTPYLCDAAPMNGRLVEIGREQYRSVLAEVSKCRDSDVWPGLERVKEWTAPAWMDDNYQVKIS